MTARVAMPARVNHDHDGAGRLPGAAGHHPVRPVPGADQHRLARAVRHTDGGGRRMRAWAWLLALTAALAARLRSDDPERGDVPGWGVVTGRTAGLGLRLP